MSHRTLKTGTEQRAIGVFDSGVGGLSVLQHIVHQMPNYDVLYLADSVHVPYGDRDAREIQSFSEIITQFLIDRGACVVVVACNTASAAALGYLRARFEIPLVGMEPAVKPAAEQTHSQHIGVIATRATFQGQLFARLVERFARNTKIHTKVCPGLVELVEAGLLDHPDTKALLTQYLSPMLDEQIDSLVLGCTHYPFLRPAIEQVMGPSVTVVDPAPAVARQTSRVLAESGNRCDREAGQMTYYTSGDPAKFQDMMRRLVDIPGPIRAVKWERNKVNSSQSLEESHIVIPTLE